MQSISRGAGVLAEPLDASEINEFVVADHYNQRNKSRPLAASFDWIFSPDEVWNGTVRREIVEFIAEPD
jgi:hypothetical protein